MTRGLNSFKRTDVARLCRAVTDAGLTVRGVEVADGTVRVLTDKSDGESEQAPRKVAPEDIKL